MRIHRAKKIVAAISSDDIYYLAPQYKARVLVKPSAYSEWVRAKCSPPTVSEWVLFKARGFNFLCPVRSPSPTNPAYWAFISKLDQAEKCETDLVREVRNKALGKFTRP